MRNKIYGFLVVLLFSFSSLVFAVDSDRPAHTLSARELDGLRHVFNECKSKSDKSQKETCVKDALQVKNSSRIKPWCVAACMNTSVTLEQFSECVKSCY